MALIAEKLQDFFGVAKACRWCSLLNFCHNIANPGNCLPEGELVVGPHAQRLL